MQFNLSRRAVVAGSAGSVVALGSGIVANVGALAVHSRTTHPLLIHYRKVGDVLNNWEGPEDCPEYAAAEEACSKAYGAVTYARAKSPGEALALAAAILALEFDHGEGRARYAPMIADLERFAAEAGYHV